MKKVTHIEMTDRELDNLIKEHFGQKYEVVAVEEWSNDSQHTFTVDGEVDEDDQEAVDKFRETGRGMWLTGRLLNSLAKTGAIEKGNYLVRCSW